MPKVAIIIVNWNGIKDTLVCLESLSKMNTKGVDCRIIVVDNGSTNDSIAQIHSKYPDTIVLENTENLGFTGGNNRGMYYALGLGIDYVWLLNNDTKVHESALLEYVSAAKETHAGIIGAKIYFDKGHEFHFDRYKETERGHVFWYAGGIIDWKNMYVSHRGVDEIDHGQYDSLEITPFVTGCSMFIRRDVLETVGLFDDAYYLYLEDADLCFRAIRKGFSLWYAPKAILWHVNAGSSARPGNTLQEYYMTRNRLRVGFLYAPLRTRLALIREAFRFILMGSGVKRKAIFDWLRGCFGNQFVFVQ